MKRFLLVFPIMAMALCACTKQPIPHESTTDSTASIASSSATTTMEGQTDPAPISLKTKDDFTNFIRNTTVDGLHLYSRALGCIFEKPEDIPAYLLFYGGVGEKSGQFAQEETTFLVNAFKEKNLEVMKILHLLQQKCR